jgi:hypothetical protein
MNISISKSIFNSKVIIGLTIISFAIIWFVYFWMNVKEFKLIHEIDISVFQSIILLFYSNMIILPILIICALVGYFIRKIFGWILISLLFYYTFFEISLVLIPAYSSDTLGLVFAIIPLLPLVIMNLNNIRIHYKIVDKDKLLFYNSLTIIIAIILAYIKGFVLMYNNISVFEILEKI